MRKLTVILLTLCITGKLASAQDEKFKALFMYNFTKYLEWPSDQKKGEFVIGVYGPSPIIQELNIIAEKKTVGNQPIVVRKIIELEDASKCNIIYIPERQSSKIGEIYQKCASRGILIITDKEGMGKTFAGINYIKVNGKQNFEVNRKNIEGKGIKVNSALLELGIEVK